MLCTSELRFLSLCSSSLFGGWWRTASVGKVKRKGKSSSNKKGKAEKKETKRCQPLNHSHTIPHPLIHSSAAYGGFGLNGNFQLHGANTFLRLSLRRSNSLSSSWAALPPFSVRRVVKETKKLNKNEAATSRKKSSSSLCLDFCFDCRGGFCFPS